MPYRVRRSLPLLGAALLYALLAVLLLQPASLSISTRLIGNGACDLYLGVWGFWWYAQCLLHGQSPLHTRLFSFPQGGTLSVADPLNAALSVPLQLVFPLPVAYNLMVLGHLVFAGTAAWCLLRHLRLSMWAAWLGGVIFGFNAFMLGYVHNAVTQEISTGWFPLVMLRVLIAWRRPSRTNVAWATLALTLGLISSWYHAASLLLMLLVTGLPALQKRGGKAAGTLVRVTMLSLLCLSAFLYAQIYAASQPDTLEVRGERKFEVSMNGHEASDLYYWFHCERPTEEHYNQYVHRVYFSPLMLALALAALCSPRRRSLTARTALRIAGLLSVLSAGYYLHIHGTLVTVGEHLVPLPELYLHQYVPGFSWLDFPHRLIVPAYLALGYLGGLGLDVLCSLVHRRSAPLVVLGVLNLLLWEIGSKSPVPLPIASVDARPLASSLVVRDLAGAGTIDLPAQPHGGAAKRYIYEQVHHRKAIPFGIDVCMSSLLPGTFGVDPAMHTLALMSRFPAIDSHHRRPGELALALARLGYGSVVVHLDVLGSRQEKELCTRLTLELGPPRELPDAWIFTLAPPSQGRPALGGHP